VDREPQRDKALSLVTRHCDLARKMGVAVRAAEAGHSREAFDVVVNATATSLTARRYLWAHESCALARWPST